MGIHWPLQEQIATGEAHVLKHRGRGSSQMSRKARRVLPAIVLAATAAMAIAAASASAITVPYTFTNWAVSGSLTPKKLNEPVVLPKGSTFNGTSELTTGGTSGEVSGPVSGTIFVPPFKATLKLLGAVPSTVGVTFTQVGAASGSVANAPPADCAGSRFSGPCVTLSVTTRANIGLTDVGSGGLELPTNCVTSEPVSFSLSSTLPVAGLLREGPHFTGTVTIPNLTCEGLSGIVIGPALSALMSGPENPYSLKIGPREPAAPTVTTGAATGVSQVSARLTGDSEPNGEPESNCHFEYGTSTSYGTSAPCASPAAFNFEEMAQLSNLSEGTTYHYRLVATNPLGTTDGEDQTFTTLGPTGAPEYGECVAQKKGNYSNASCTQFGTKKGKPVEHAGSFEFESGPAAECVAQKKGEYTDAECTTKSAKARKGTYERVPGSSFTSTGGAVTLETLGVGHTVTCSGSTATGAVTSTTGGSEQITLTGCATSGKACQSEGPQSTPSATAGVIITNPLATRLLGPVEGQVWTELTSSEHQPYLAEFNCEGLSFRVSGSLSGVQNGNIDEPSTTTTTTFAPPTQEHGLPEGEQGLLTAVSEDGGTSWTAPEATSTSALLSNTSASAIEIHP